VRGKGVATSSKSYVATPPRTVCGVAILYAPHTVCGVAILYAPHTVWGVATPVEEARGGCGRRSRVG